MPDIHAHFAEIGLMDRLAAGDTPIHQIDPKAKLLTTLVFIATVVSFGKYEISALLPFFLYPVVLMTVGELPVADILKRMLLLAPFAVLIGIFNPMLDRAPLLTIGALTITGGWVSFLSIILRFILTVTAALALLACTGIHGVCLALEKLGTPRVFTVQLLFLYRYLFLLVDEGARMVRARALRSCGNRGMGIKHYGPMLGHLLLRALDRAQRVHTAMSSRGFDGHIHTRKPLKPGLRDIAFVAFWALLLAVMRIHNVSHLLGSFVMEVLS
jgi:cobalt/nickel transport system permease protein